MLGNFFIKLKVFTSLKIIKFCVFGNMMSVSLACLQNARNSCSGISLIIDDELVISLRPNLYKYDVYASSNC